MKFSSSSATRTVPNHMLAIDMGDWTEEQVRQYLATLHSEMSKREQGAELARVRYLSDPAAWVTEKLREELWLGERNILSSVSEHRRTLVKSCHEVGKSFTAARVACWWIDSHKAGEAFVITSAPTAYQVKSVLWREIGRAHQKGQLAGQLNLTEWWLDMGGREELVAFGRKPDEYDIAAFQGIHAPYVLVILDEACGIHGPLWDAADSLIANDNSKMLVIGNPDDPKSEFHDNARPGSDYNVVTICAFDSPNFTGEKMDAKVLMQLIGRTYVEEKRRRWAPSWYWVNAQGERCEPEDGVRVVPPCDPNDHKAMQEALMQVNPYWCSKVLGEFPPVGGQLVLIPPAWIANAQARTLAATSPNTLGVDVGAGGDASAICHRQGPMFRIIHEDTNPDTMQTTGTVVDAWRRTRATEIRIDNIGIGKGVVDRLSELQELKDANVKIIGVNVGTPAIEPEYYLNLKSEGYWSLRERAEEGRLDLDAQDEELAAQLSDIRFERSSRGTIKIESKEDARKRGVASPNRAEAVMLSHVQLPEPEGGALAGKVTW